MPNESGYRVIPSGVLMFVTTEKAIGIIRLHCSTASIGLLHFDETNIPRALILVLQLGQKPGNSSLCQDRFRKHPFYNHVTFGAIMKSNGIADTERLRKIDANRKLAFEICQRWSVKKGGDVEPYFELFHDDATFTTIAQKGMLPILAGTLTKDEFRAWVFKESRVGDVKVKVEGITADEDRLALEASSDMAINGNSYCNRYHWLFEIKDGKIAAARFYLDTLFAKEAMRWVDEAEATQKPS
jgi:ketosteroid isomerase-like protein